MSVVLARVETIREGDEIVLPGFIGTRTVSELEEYDDDTYVVVYAALDWSERQRQYVPCTKGLKSMRKGERFPTIRRAA
jgi:hypothetical protein